MKQVILTTIGATLGVLIGNVIIYFFEKRRRMRLLPFKREFYELSKDDLEQINKVKVPFTGGFP